MSRRSMLQTFGTYFTVEVVPVLKDNYTYIITDSATRATAIVDTSEVAPVLKQLQQRPHWNDISTAKGMLNIFTTHKHWDHSGGNKDFHAKFPTVEIFGGEHEPVPEKTVSVKHNETFPLGDLHVTAYHTPCHTSGHVVYHVYHPSDRSNGALFTGDTVFIGGLGAFFEGNSEMMVEAMTIVSSLPDETKIFPGHEYTMTFIKNAAAVLPADSFIQAQLSKYAALREEGVPTVPSTLADEKRQNLFMRVLDESFVKAIGKSTAVEAMQHLYDTCP